MMKWIISILLLLLSHGLLAQYPTVNLALDTNQILIGEQVSLQLEVLHDPAIEIEWPEWKDNLGDMEVVRTLPIDSSSKEGLLRKAQIIHLTAWDSGYYDIPGILVHFYENQQRKKVKTKKQSIAVSNVAVNLEEDIRPIKDIIALPMTWGEIMRYVLIGLLGLFLLIGLIYYFSKRKKVVEEVEGKKQVIVKEAHEIALEKLQVLEESKLWQKGETKAYYVGLTDIIREYMEGRFNISAFEYTSDEIMGAMKGLNVKNTIKDRLGEMFTYADLAKFAKAQPTTENNIQSFKDVRKFVLHTKKTASTDEQEEETEMTEV